jgi:hypothetical protein
MLIVAACGTKRSWYRAWPCRFFRSASFFPSNELRPHDFGVALKQANRFLLTQAWQGAGQIVKAEGFFPFKSKRVRAAGCSRERRVSA